MINTKTNCNLNEKLNKNSLRAEVFDPIFLHMKIPTFEFVFTALWKLSFLWLSESCSSIEVTISSFNL